MRKLYYNYNKLALKFLTKIYECNDLYMKLRNNWRTYNPCRIIQINVRKEEERLKYIVYIVYDQDMKLFVLIFFCDFMPEKSAIYKHFTKIVIFHYILRML